MISSIWPRATLPGRFWDQVEKVETLREGNQTIHVLSRDVLPRAHINQFIQDDSGFVGMVRALDDERVELLDLCKEQLMHQRMWGLKPRNLEQAMAFFMISRPNIDMTVLTGLPRPLSRWPTACTRSWRRSVSIN